MSGVRRVACPTCRREFEWTDAARWRPFCSERCRLIDLGEWLGERHAIPGEPQGAPAAEAGSDDRHR
ncbi:MAG: DNA gyrase inhibitor YacG [Steroidobacteraceae bacterium]